MKKGFTLIELLIVIAILGTLAVVVLLALNPVQQLARTRDAGRESTVAQLGHAIEAYATGNNGVYPTAGATWISTLVTAGEISTVPGAVTYTVSGSGACTTNAQNGWCYSYTAGTGAVVFTRLESGANNSKCTTAGQVAWFVYSTAAGRGGGTCSAAGTPPAPGVTTFAF